MMVLTNDQIIDHWSQGAQEKDGDNYMVSAKFY